MIDFEKFLQEYFSDNNPEILDDDQVDAFSDWITDLDPDEWIRLGNIYAKKVIK